MSGGGASIRALVTGTWNGFWFERGNTFTLGLFRIFFAYCLWREVGTTHARSVFGIEGGFHLPYVPFVQPVSSQIYDWIHLAQYPLVLLLGIGLYSRVAAGGLLALHGYIFFADQLNFRNHPYLFLLVLLILVFSPCDDALSLRRLRSGRERQEPDPRAYLGSWKPLTAQRLIQVQLSLVYFYAALHKLNGYFLSGGVLSRQISRDLFDDFSGQLVHVFLSPAVVDWLKQATEEHERFVIPAVLTVAIEMFLAFGLWFRRSRPYAFALGFALHGGIALVMNIKTFSFATLATYLLFLPPAALPTWLARQFGDAPGAQPPRPRADA